MVSSELPEVLGMSHRVLVVRGGEIRAEFARADATPRQGHRRRGRGRGIVADSEALRPAHRATVKAVHGRARRRRRRAEAPRRAAAHRRPRGRRSSSSCCVVNVLAHGNFLEPGNLTNVLRQITVNAIMAVGQTFVIITAGIDLSVGSLIALTGVVMAQVANALPFGGAGKLRRHAARRPRRRLRRRATSTRCRS